MKSVKLKHLPPVKFTDHTMVKVIDVVKDGIDQVKYVWEIDESKPKCYREGFSYKFNSVLLQRIKIPK